MATEPKLILLIGIGGAGKSTISFRLAQRLAGRCCLYSEDSQEATDSGLEIHYGAFNRAFVENVAHPDTTLYQAIVEHCLGVIRNFPPPPKGSIIIIDRWYDTYVSGVQLPPAHVSRIERAILAAGITGYMINLVVDDDHGTVMRRLIHTRAHRPREWWEEHLGTMEERASSDLKSQRDNRLLGLRTELDYMEVNTTTMQWEDAIDKILGVVHPAAS